VDEVKEDSKEDLFDRENKEEISVWEQK